MHRDIKYPALLFLGEAEPVGEPAGLQIQGGKDQEDSSQQEAFCFRLQETVPVR